MSFSTWASRFSACPLLDVGFAPLLGLRRPRLFLLARPLHRDPLLPPGLEKPQRRADDPADQGQQHQRRRDHLCPIPPHELPQPIADDGGPALTGSWLTNRSMSLARPIAES